MSFCLFLFSGHQGQAQVNPKAFSYWYFGDQAGIKLPSLVDGFTSTSTVLTDGAMKSLEGCATIADEEGNLMFYTNGKEVWNNKHELMVNGTGLKCDTNAAQAVLIIPQPKQTKHYYVFTLDKGRSGHDMFYSVVDMSRNNGGGEVITRNVPVRQNLTERVTATIHNNGDDYWVMVHEANNSRFLAFLFDNKGFNATPVVSNIGSAHEGNCGGIGYMKVRCDKVAVAITNCTIATTKDRVEIFNFDNSNGRVYSHDRTHFVPNVYGVEFSLTGRYVFVSGWHGGNIFRIDLRASKGQIGEFLKIAQNQAYGSHSEMNSFGALMMGPDGNIYVAKNKSGFLDIIRGDGFYSKDEISLKGRKGSFGLPNTLQFFCGVDVYAITSRARGCVNFAKGFKAERVFPLPKRLMAPPLRWDFGNPYASPPSTNTSIANPTSHVYTREGLYKVKLYKDFGQGEKLVGIQYVSIRDCGKIVYSNACFTDFTRFRLTGIARAVSVAWDFGDPASGIHNTSTLFTPKHYYARPGKYIVTAVVTFRDGVKRIYRTKVIVQKKPNAYLGPDIDICNGDKLPPIINLCGQFGASYLWQDSTTNCYYVPKPTDNFIAVRVRIGVCEAIDTMRIGYPIVSLGPERKICPGDSVVLSPNGKWGSYLWQNGSTDSFFVAKTSGTYSVIVTRGRCTLRASVKVRVVMPPAINLPKDTVVCPPDKALFLNVAKADTTVKYLWSNGATTPFQLINTSGTYWVELRIGSCKRRDSIKVTMVKPLGLPDDLTSCAADSLTPLNAGIEAPGATYLWSTGSTDSLIVVKEKGWYKVTATYKSCVQTDSTFLDFGKKPVIDLGKDTTICGDSTLVIDAFVPGKDYTYLWNTGETTSFIKVNKSGIYTVTVSNDSCMATDSIFVTFPMVELGPDINSCSGDTVTVKPLQLLPGAIYTWSTGAIADSLRVPPPGGKIIVTMNYKGCLVKDSLLVMMTLNLPVNLGKDTIICDPTTPLVLKTGTSGVGITHIWSNGSTADSLVADSSGVYWVEVHQGDCVERDTITINYLDIAFPKDSTVCDSQTVVLDATQPLSATYTWQDGSTSPVFLALTGGTYWVDITMGSCTRRDSIQVKQVPRPTIDLGKDTMICNNDPFILSTGNPATVWSTGASGPSLMVNTTGLYVATISTGGCIVSDSIRVTYINDLTFDLGPNQLICDQRDYIIDASKSMPPGLEPSIVSYLWADDNSTNYFKHVRSDGWYKVKVSLNASCGVVHLVDSIYVSFGTTPTVNLGRDRLLCPGETVTLNATSILNNVTYLWQDGSRNATYQVAQTGTYWVEVENNGCKATDRVNVIYANDFDLGPDKIVCNQNPLLLNAFVEGATSYLWQDGSTNPYFNVIKTGLYWVEVGNGRCKFRDSIRVDYVPQPTISLGADTIVCNVEKYTIKFNAEAGVTYQWNDGSNADSLLVTKSGWYWVDATRNTCSNRDSVFIFLPQVYLSLGGDTTICSGTELTLGNLPVAGLTYNWNTGSTSSMITITKAGAYFLEVNMAGCVFRDRVQVTVRECDSIVDNLFIPNIITPNQDGKNDRFVIEGISNKGWGLEIYNRWGSRIYSADNYRNDWNGPGFPSGLYYYHLKHPTDKEKKYKGWLKILR